MRDARMRFLLAFGGLIVGIVLAEVTLRLLEMAPAESVITVTEAQFVSIPGIWAPNQRLLDRHHPALPYEVTTDSLGFRGESFPRAKPHSEYRILLVGDSFTFGQFVDDSETLPAQLEAQFGMVCRGVRVINAGLGGSTIVDQVHLVERSLSLEPDLVVLVYSENDVLDLVGRSMWQELADNRSAKSRFPLALFYPTLRKTALWNLALRMRAQLRQRRDEGAVPNGPLGEERWIDELRSQYERILSALSDQLEARGIPLIFVVYPSHFSLHPEGTPASLAWASAIGVKLGLPTFDLRDTLRATGLQVEALYLLPHDGHPSPQGYRVSGAYLSRKLLRLPSFDDHCVHGRPGVMAADVEFTPRANTSASTPVVIRASQ